MTTKPKAGDLVEFNGRRYVATGEIVHGESHIRALPATKSGKGDKRFDGQLLPWRNCVLISSNTNPPARP